MRLHFSARPETLALVIGVALSATVVLTGCGGNAVGMPSTAESSAAIPLDATYTFTVQNDTDSDVALQTFDEQCMIKTLDGKVAPHKVAGFHVETKTGQGCEATKESYFETTFSKNRAGDYANYRFVKRTLSPWRLEHRHHGPRANFSVELTNEFRFTSVRIYKHG